MITRREFLAGVGAAGALAAGVLAGHLIPDGGKPTAAAAGTGTSDGHLVVITLYGGNDGLNTVVPYADPAYRSARPTLGYSAAEILELDDHLGLNGRLKGLHGLWQRGDLAVVRGVGYPNPNLSHFASMAIWQTANPVDGTGAGWLGRWLDSSDGDPMRALSIGPTLPPMLRGDRYSATAITSAGVRLPGGTRLQAAFSAMQAAGPDRTGMAGQVAASGTGLLAAKERIDRLSAHSMSLGTGALAEQLGVVAGLITAGAPTQVYQASLSSFDTHASEKANHEMLLGELDTAVTGFLQAVSVSPAGRRTVVMTISEFGRRPAENASGGTDHGTASPLLVAGHPVHGGRFYGDEPSLTALDADGNLKYTVDFRSVYATVLARVLGADPEKVLGGKFPSLAFV